MTNKFEFDVKIQFELETVNIAPEWLEENMWPKLFRTILFTLKFKGFKRKNFVFLFLAGVVVVFQVVIISRLLTVKSLSRKWSLYRTAVNSTPRSSVEVEARRLNKQKKFSSSLSVPVLKRFQLNSDFYSNEVRGKLKNRRFTRTEKRNETFEGNITDVNKTMRSLNTTVSPTLDFRMLHEYYPPVNFSVVIPHVAPKFDNKEIFLLVLVSSATAKSPNAERRQAIRKTWGNVKAMSNIASYSSSLKHGFPFKAMISHSFRLVFLIGKSDNITRNEEIEEEGRVYNDLVIGNFQDVYNNLIIKVYMGFKWAENIKCKFILKGDDDTYIYLPRLMLVLHHAPVRFFGGYVMSNSIVLREISNKHAISKMYFSEKYYPPYCGGPFYIFTHNLIPQFLSLTEKFRPFHVEDAYLGILLREMGIKPLFLPGFHLRNWMISDMQNFNPCDWATSIALGHMFNSSHIEYVHARLPLHEPSRLTTSEWQACRRKTRAATSDSMLPIIYGTLFSLAMILVYVTVTVLPRQYEYEEPIFIVEKKRRYYYPFIYRSTR